MKDLPTCGDRVQVRAGVTREGKLMGGAIGTVTLVVAIDCPGRRDIGVIVQTGVGERYLFALFEVAVIGAVKA